MDSRVTPAHNQKGAQRPDMRPSHVQASVSWCRGQLEALIPCRA